MLEEEFGSVEVEEVGDVETALQTLESHVPALVVSEIALVGHSGIDLVKQIVERWPELPVLVFSSREETVYAERVLRAGASGFVSKSADSDRFVEAVRRVLSGQMYASSAVSRSLLAGIAGSRAEGGSVDHLSDQEFAVFELIGQGCKRGEIARLLSLSPQTVGSYRTRIMSKLQIDGGAHLAQVAVQWVAANS